MLQSHILLSAMVTENRKKNLCAADTPILFYLFFLLFSLCSIECPETWIYWAINNISYWNFMKWRLWESAKWECVYFSAKWIAITPGEAGKRGLKFSQTWLHLTSNKHKWLRLWQRPDLAVWQLTDSWTYALSPQTEAGSRTRADGSSYPLRNMQLVLNIQCLGLLA